MKSTLYSLFAWESSTAVVMILAVLVLLVVVALIVKVLGSGLPTDPLARDLLDAEFERRYNHYNGK